MVWGLRTTTSQKCEAVQRRAGILRIHIYIIILYYMYVYMYIYIYIHIHGALANLKAIQTAQI